MKLIQSHGMQLRPMVHTGEAPPVPAQGLLDAEALLAASNDLGGGHSHFTATQLVTLSENCSQGMLNLSYSIAANPSITPGQAAVELASYSIYGPYTAYEAQPMEPLTLAEAEAAVQIVGTTVGWHFWG
jgi:hypothetical protein